MILATQPIKEVKSVCVVWYRFNSHGVLRFFICFFFLTCPGISCSWQTKSTLLFWWFACRFVRNLLYFYKPSSQRFCTVHISDPQAKTFSEVGCLLVDFLIESEDVRVILLGYVQAIPDNVLACENIRFSSLFAAGDVSRETFTAKRPQRRRARRNGCFRGLITFAPPRKSYRIGLLLTHKNGRGGAMPLFADLESGASYIG